MGKNQKTQTPPPLVSGLGQERALVCVSTVQEDSKSWMG